MASVESLGGNKYKIYVDVEKDDYNERRRRTKTVTVTSDRDLKKKVLAFEMACKNEPVENLDKITVDKFVDKWLKNHVNENLATGTRISYMDHLPHIREYFGKMKIKKVKRLHIDEFFISEKNEGRKSFSVKLTILQSVFGKAIEWDIITTNPTQRYKLKNKAEPKELNVYTSDELELFFKLLDTESERNRLMLLAASLGALRRGEVLGFGEDVIDYENNTVHITRSLNWDSDAKRKYLGPPKGRKKRKIVYPESFMRELRIFIFKQNELKWKFGNLWESVDDIDLLFRTGGDVMHPNYFSQLWKNACGRMGLRIINLHSLRHSSATYLHRDGMNIKALQEFLGHSKYETTANTYIHNEKEDMLLPSEKFKKFL